MILKKTFFQTCDKSNAMQKKNIFTKYDLYFLKGTFFGINADLNKP